ncbi:leucine-rich repeats and immunoglobulin-like domains protein 1 isoform X2 [Halichondria panicea]|uniref:leucine-rich repeats and immunoglobulin-like domains protein 1 isoform X2 n=1 Tax=Halichondria panicea TaxID=6063 RepID=UPI00312B57B0
MASLLLWSVYLFLSVLSHATAQELEVSFEFEVEHVVINGNGAVARCTVTGSDSSLDTISSFIWKHNNTIIDLSSSTRHSESGSKGTRRLDITSLMFNDAGRYSCTVEFVNLQRVSSTTDTLQIGTEITVEAESLQYAVAGQTGELRCTAQSSPPPSINWYRDESDTPLLQQFDSTASDFGVYRISNVQTDDAGLYKRRGSYSFGSEEKEIQLLVLTAEPSGGHSPLIDDSFKTSSSPYYIPNLVLITV